MELVALLFVLVSFASADVEFGYASRDLKQGDTLTHAKQRLDADACLPGYSVIEGTDDCFRVYSIAKAYADAEEYCKQDGGHLASIHSADERHNLNDIVGTASPLIGIVCSSTTSCTWSDGSPMDYQNFVNGQPLLDYGSCAHLFSDDDKFYSWNCDTPMNAFLCRIKSNLPPLDCSPGYTAVRDQCAVVKSHAKTSAEAESECSLEGGHLASIHDLNTNYLLANLASNSTLICDNFQDLSCNVHIGARYDKKIGYGWTDGTPFDFSNWAAPEFPDTRFGECSQMLVTNEFGTPGQWTNIPCDTKLPYMCMKAPGISPTYAPMQCPRMQYFEDRGTIYSPGFPVEIPSGLYCEYLLVADVGNRLSLNFPFFNIDSYSKLAVYDGMAAANPAIVLSGEVTSSKTYNSTQNIVKLVFETDSKTEGEGWEAAFTTLSRCTRNLQAAIGFHTDISSVPRDKEFRTKAEKIFQSITNYFDIPTVRTIDIDDETCEFNKEQEKNKSLFYGSFYANSSSVINPTFCMSNMDSYPNNVATADYRQAAAVTLQSVIDSYTKWYNSDTKMICHCFDYTNPDTTKILMWAPLSPTSLDADYSKVTFKGFDMAGFTHIVMPFGFEYKDSPLWRNLVPDPAMWLTDASREDYAIGDIIEDFAKIVCRLAGRPWV